MDRIQTFFENLGNRIRAGLRGLMARLRSFLQVPRNRNVTIAVIVLLVGSLLVRVDEPHVSLAAEPLLEDGTGWFTNSMLTTFIVDLIIIVLALMATVRMKLVPTGWQSFMEWIIEGMYNLTESIAGHNARKFFPWAMTIFLFVIVSNYFGLLPGVGSIGVYHGGEAAGEHALAAADHIAMAGEDVVLAATPDQQAAAAAAEEEGHATFVPLFRSPSADLNMTLALAIISVGMTQVWGIQALGLKYFRKFFADPRKDAMATVVGILELIAEISKIISFAFRLFGNIFAGEVVLVVMAFLVTFLLPIAFYGLELFIGFLQALVFMLLSVAFFAIATVSHDEH